MPSLRFSERPDGTLHTRRTDQHMDPTEMRPHPIHRRRHLLVIAYIRTQPQRRPTGMFDF